MAFLSRHPFATDAFELGFATGIREDYNLFEGGQPRNVELPVTVLDNDFNDPNIGRYLERFEKYDPSVAILGDAYSRVEAQTLDRIAKHLLEERPQKTIIAVPKCEDAFNELSGSVVLGVPIGYSDIHADDLGWQNYRGRDVHILGGSPTKAYDAIEKLTQPNLTGDEPANVKGLDWNGPHKIAYLGEYWSPNGWKRADHLSIRETVRKSLAEIKEYWQGKGVWPDTEPRDLYGPAVQEPDELIYMDQGGDPIPGREALEDSIVESYRRNGEEVTWAFTGDTERKYLEYHENLEPV